MSPRSRTRSHLFSSVRSKGRLPVEQPSPDSRAFCTRQPALVVISTNVTLKAAAELTKTCIVGPLFYSCRSCRSLQGIFHFQLARGEPMLHTRLRPHCKDFLEKIAKLYELHVFTFGSRLYAHTIAGNGPLCFYLTFPTHYSTQINCLHVPNEQCVLYIDTECCGNSWGSQLVLPVCVHKREVSAHVCVPSGALRASSCLHAS